MRAGTALSTVIVVVGLAGCGAGAASTTPSPPIPVAPARVSFARSFEGSSTSARLATVEGPTWVEVRVAGDDPSALRVCERLLESEREARTRAIDRLAITDRLVIARACAPAPLPAIEIDAGSHVLIDEREVEAADLALLGLEREIEASITELHGLPSVERCEALRARLGSAQARARAEAAAHAREWIEQQRTHTAANAERSCAERDAIAQRCAAGRPRSAARASCEIELERAERECANERTFLEVIDARIATEPATVSEPRCVAAEG